MGGVRGAEHALIGAVHQLHYAMQERRRDGQVVQARIRRVTGRGPEQKHHQTEHERKK
jgi:hypothetical protein